jgi:DNA-binding transcriptional MocR family regulator
MRRLAVLARYPRLAAARSHPRSAHVWLTLPDRWRADEFVGSAAVHGIAIAQTHSFVVGRTSMPHAVRLCIGAAGNLGALEIACDRLERLLGTAPRIGMEAA